MHVPHSVHIRFTVTASGVSIAGNLHVGGTASVAQTSTLVGNVVMSGTASVTQTSALLGNVRVGTGFAGNTGGTDLTAAGAVSMKTSLKVSGTASVAQTSTGLLLVNLGFWIFRFPYFRFSRFLFFAKYVR